MTDAPLEERIADVLLARIRGESHESSKIDHWTISYPVVEPVEEGKCVDSSDIIKFHYDKGDQAEYTFKLRLGRGIIFENCDDMEERHAWNASFDNPNGTDTGSIALEELGGALQNLAYQVGIRVVGKFNPYGNEDIARWLTANGYIRLRVDQRIDKGLHEQEFPYKQ